MKKRKDSTSKELQAKTGDVSTSEGGLAQLDLWCSMDARKCPKDKSHGKEHREEGDVN